MFQVISILVGISEGKAKRLSTTWIRILKQRKCIIAKYIATNTVHWNKISLKKSFCFVEYNIYICANFNDSNCVCQYTITALTIPFPLFTQVHRTYKTSASALSTVLPVRSSCTKSLWKPPSIWPGRRPPLSPSPFALIYSHPSYRSVSKCMYNFIYCFYAVFCKIMCTI